MSNTLSEGKTASTNLHCVSPPSPGTVQCTKAAIVSVSASFLNLQPLSPVYSQPFYRVSGAANRYPLLLPVLDTPLRTIFGMLVSASI
ncbi:hypothetical protein XELAEV_18027082mg [Xenopus laevis]|uniref:Uncharacterized protein n=1 Tax=Xenopus laevis TaxID=8355 RepID=A0A974CUW5_XENLA|nr:hypothetical protein XELAEV_18027082mg [Xenopus laevis]